MLQHGIVFAVPAKLLPESKRPKAKLLREWLITAVTPGIYFTITCESEVFEEVDTVKPFGVMNFEIKHLKTKLADVEDSLPTVGGSILQPLERWAPRVEDQTGMPDELETFMVEDACVVDVLALTGVEPGDRKKLVEWDWRESDVQGCRTL